MSTKQMFSCTHCEKSFEMRIKLNRHIANYHNREDDFDFTKLGIELSDDQKVKYFDKLREKFKDLKGKVLTRQALLKSRERTHQVKRDKANSFPTDEKVRVKKEMMLSGLEDIVLPPGWKIKAFDKAMHISSPGGVSFKSVHGALRHLVQNPKEPGFGEAIASFRSKLLKDGWHTDNSLPDGWLTMSYKGWTRDRRNCWTRQHFLTPQFDFLKGQEEVIRWLRSTGAGEEEVRTALGSEWIEHPRLSQNWLFRTNQFGNNRSSLVDMITLFAHIFFCQVHEPGWKAF